MIKKIKKIIGLNADNSQSNKDTTYVDNRTYVCANDSVFTRPNIGTSNLNNSSKPIKENVTDTSKRKNELNNCNPNCPCWGQSITLPRKCPICGYEFKRHWWGIDRHYETEHESDLGMSYQEWRSQMCDEHRPGK